LTAQVGAPYALHRPHIERSLTGIEDAKLPKLGRRTRRAGCGGRPSPAGAGGRERAGAATWRRKQGQATTAR